MSDFWEIEAWEKGENALGGFILISFFLKKKNKTKSNHHSLLTVAM
jgi:hypothetical protein